MHLALRLNHENHVYGEPVDLDLSKNAIRGKLTEILNYIKLQTFSSKSMMY